MLISQATPQSSALSRGAIAGVVIGGVFGLIGIAGIVAGVCIYITRARTRRSNSGLNMGPMPVGAN
jgi:predicted oxidoreductase